MGSMGAGFRTLWEDEQSESDMYAVLKTYIGSFGSNDSIQKRKEDYGNAVCQFKKQYQKVKQMEQELRQVSSARKNFMAQKASFHSRAQGAKTLQSKQEQNAAQFLKEMQDLDQELKLAGQTLERYRTELSEAQYYKFWQDRTQTDIENQIQNIRRQIMELEGSRRIWDVILEIFHRPTMLSRTIQEHYEVLAKAEQAFRDEATKAAQLRWELERQTQKYNAKSNAIMELKRRQNRLVEKRQNCLNQADQLQVQIEESLKKIEEARSLYQRRLKEASGRQADQRMTVLSEEFFHLYDSKEDSESTAAQVANPWHTAAYNREREKLFYEALKLHKAFLLGSKACLWNFKNLLLLWKEPRDDDKKTVTVSKRDREAAFGSLLNTVFLLTPVLSTTFASAGTMLSSIRRSGEIGCLIIDEAGQAAPQMALGSLFRCRRAIVVGDPKQVEPVVTDELDLIKQVIQNDDTSYYQSKTHSVQEFADRLNTNWNHLYRGWRKNLGGVPSDCASTLYQSHV
ncbi:MAG: hypothetical protein HFI63_03150 [Lachnospiraceae bacterium]|nr:hypothetical protein [Lachnospiraceae bacterium]